MTSHMHETKEERKSRIESQIDAIASKLHRNPYTTKARRDRWFADRIEEMKSLQRILNLIEVY